MFEYSLSIAYATLLAALAYCFYYIKKLKRELFFSNCCIEHWIKRFKEVNRELVFLKYPDPEALPAPAPKRKRGRPGKIGSKKGVLA